MNPDNCIGDEVVSDELLVPNESDELAPDDATCEEQAPEIEVLYEDEDVVAIHKPAGLLVHRSYLARRERFLRCNWRAIR